MYVRQRLDHRRLWSPDTLSGDDVLCVLDAAQQLRDAQRKGDPSRVLQGRNVAMLHADEPPDGAGSLRGAAAALGATVAHVRPAQTRLETDDLSATARMLGRLYDAIDCESLAPDVLDAISREAGVPVYDGLGHESHPALVLAEWLAMRERCGKPLHRLSVCYLGAADSPCADVLLQTAAVTGVELRLCAPRPTWPGVDRLELAARRAAAGHRLELVEPDGELAACADADIVIDGRGNRPWQVDGISDGQRRDCRHFTLQALLLATMH